MAGVGVSVVGLRETVRNLEKLGANVADLKDVFARVGALVAGRVTAPRRTGALDASVRPARAKNRARIRAGGARAPWAPFVEFGPRPQPFLRPALDASRADAVRLVDSGLAAILSRLDL